MGKVRLFLSELNKGTLVYSQAEGQSPLKQAIIDHYNNKSNEKQAKQFPTWSQNWLLLCNRLTPLGLRLCCSLRSNCLSLPQAPAGESPLKASFPAPRSPTPLSTLLKPVRAPSSSLLHHGSGNHVPLPKGVVPWARTASFIDTLVSPL